MPPEVTQVAGAVPDGAARRRRHPHRKVAILVADGVHGASVVAVQAALERCRRVACIIAPHLGPVQTADGESVEASGDAGELPPVLFDALVLPDGERGGNACWPDVGRRWSS
jgi:hypothetical protein